MAVFEQADRFCTISRSPLGPDTLLVKGMEVHEGISQLTRIELDLLSEDDKINFEKVLGESLTVKLKLVDGSTRFFDGIVSRFSQGSEGGQFVSYRAEVVPKLWLLTRTSNVRFFEDKSVPDIITQILDDSGVTDKRKVLSSHPTRDYCVQYRETDFDFISRLMEEEGISWFVEHEEKKHTIVFFDAPSGNKPYRSDPKLVYAGAENENRDPGEIEQWSYQREVPSGKVVLQDYNYESPSDDLEQDQAAKDAVGKRLGKELFDYPGRYTTGGEGGRLAKLRMEAEECAAYRVSGRNGRIEFCPGFTFKLQGYYRNDQNGDYLITSVKHSVTDEGPGVTVGGAAYQNSFTCIPHSVPFRCRMTTLRPIVPGLHTAKVVDQNDPDGLARVRVKFHWDHDRGAGEPDSLWIRVSQFAAGNEWGALFHPQLEDEVLVSFVEGDPDRPIITGRVYNGTNTPFYESGQVPTRFGILTPEGNELRFDDSDDERIFVHAVKDHRTEVDQDSALIVEQKIEIESNSSEISIKAPQKIVIECGGSKVEMTPSAIEITSAQVTVEGSGTAELKGATVTVNGSAMTEVKGGLVKIN